MLVKPEGSKRAKPPNLSLEPPPKS